MGQKKLIKFAAIKAFDNVLEYPQGMAGNWNAFFTALEKGAVPIELAGMSISQPSQKSNENKRDKQKI